jgi:hypothetical protein
MNKKEQLAEQIAEKHLGKKNFQYYGTLQKQGVIAAIVEAMGVQQVNTCEHRWQFDEEIEGAKYCKECGKIIEAPAKAVEAMPEKKGRKWVKASERLPEVGKFLNLRLLDNKYPRCGKLRSDGFFKTDTSLFYKSNIEWLDELAPAVEANPQFTMQDFAKGLMLAGYIPPANETEAAEKAILENCKKGEWVDSHGYFIGVKEAMPEGKGEHGWTALFKDEGSYIDFLKWQKVQAVEAMPISTQALGIDTAWPLVDVLDKLIEGTEILLNKKNYDGHGWEEISLAVKKGKEVVSLLRSTKYEEKAVEAMDSLPAKKGNNYVSSNSNTDDTSLASHSFTDGSSIEQLIKWIDKRCEIEFYEAGESYDEEIHAIKSGKLKALHEVKDYLLNADNQNTPTE